MSMSRFCEVTKLRNIIRVWSLRKTWAESRVSGRSMLLVCSVLYPALTYAMQKHAAAEHVIYRAGSRLIAQDPAANVDAADECNTQEQDSLVYAVHNLGLKDVARLLAAGVDPNIPNSAGKYALHEAVRSPKPGSVDIVRLLLQKSANPEIEEIATPFYIALIARNLIFEDRVAKVQALISGGAQVDLVRVNNLLNIRRTSYLAGEYYPCQPNELKKIIRAEVDARTVMAEYGAPAAKLQDLDWRVAV